MSSGRQLVAPEGATFSRRVMRANGEGSYVFWWVNCSRCGAPVERSTRYAKHPVCSRCNVAATVAKREKNRRAS